MSVDKFGHTRTGETNNKYPNRRFVFKTADSIAPRDYVSGMRVSPGSLVRNTTSGIVYRFEGTDGTITAAPALSPNWVPTTGSAICELRESRTPVYIGTTNPSVAMHDQLTTVVINTDSAYTTADGIITIPRTGVYRLSGFVNFIGGRDSPERSCRRATYTISGLNFNELWRFMMKATSNVFGVAFALPSAAVSLVAGDQLGMLVMSESVDCQTGVCDISFEGGCGLQAEFLY